MKPTTFGSVLVANRGEIAVRILRAARAADLRTVAVYSDADRTAPHVREADTAVRLGPATAAESYLSIPALLRAAERTGAQKPFTRATGSCPSVPSSPGPARMRGWSSSGHRRTSSS